MSLENTIDLPTLTTWMALISRQVTEIRDAVAAQKSAKDYYTTAEVAGITGKSEYTVREWCRLGRVRAQKRAAGRGVSKEWMVPHDELVRLRNEGLLPLK